MINIFDDLADIGYPIYEDGNAPEDLPDEYYTVLEDSTSDHLSADNQTKEILYEFTLKFYTNKAANVYTGLIRAQEHLKAKGYIITGVGYYNNTYKNTWFSRQADIKKIEYLN